MGGGGADLGRGDLDGPQGPLHDHARTRILRAIRNEIGNIHCISTIASAINCQAGTLARGPGGILSVGAGPRLTFPGGNA